MFEKAVRMKLRLSSSKGLLSVEDLWDLPLAELNKIAKDLNKQLKNAEEEDFLKVSSKEDERLKFAFDVVLHVLNTLKDEKEARDNLAKKKKEKEKLLALLEEKQEESLKDLSVEELKKRIEELN